MTSGRDVLHKIDAAIAEARGSVGDANQAASERASRIAAIERAEADAYRSIAAIRIDSLQTDELTRSLGRADEEAERLIGDHERHLGDLARAMAEAQSCIETLESERRRRESALHETIAAHDRAVEKTNTRLEKDELYQTRARALEEANAVVERADAKLELVRSDRKEKGAPYENDPLFSYLYKRKFGTKDYRAFFLFAALDRWVAGLIRYRDARLNYDRLLELPERFADHADQVEAAASALEDDLEAYERGALERDGVNKLRDKARAARDVLEKTDTDINEAEAKYQTIANDHQRAAAGEGGPLEKARALLANVLSERSIPDLKILAAQTLTLEDDHLVDDLVRLRRERMEIDESRRSLSKTLENQSTILGELETLRRKYKSARYDSPYSEFPDRGIVSVVLSELLRGAVRERDAWRRLQRAQRRRKRNWSDDFGGEEWRDGFGLPQDWSGTSGGNWSGSGVRLPRPPRMPRTPRAPRVRIPRSRGRRGKGGFKTGGGF